MRKPFTAFVVAALLAPCVAAAAEPECPTAITPELEAGLGPPAASLGNGQSVHTPQGLTMIGQPVGYVVVIRQDGGAAAAIAEIDYRLQGVNRPFGERYPEALRKTFDASFESTCGVRATASCAVGFRANAAGELAGAELSQGNVTIGPDAAGAALALVEADFDLDDADPVYLVCLYRGAQ